MTEIQKSMSMQFSSNVWNVFELFTFHVFVFKTQINFQKKSLLFLIDSEWTQKVDKFSGINFKGKFTFSWKSSFSWKGGFSRKSKFFIKRWGIFVKKLVFNEKVGVFHEKVYFFVMKYIFVKISSITRMKIRILKVINLLHLQLDVLTFHSHGTIFWDKNVKPFLVKILSEKSIICFQNIWKVVS